MIYITGDTHASFSRFANGRMLSKGLKLTKDDYVIVCGDFGLCWAPNRTFIYDCEFFEGKPYTVLWVQGNHENYDMIQEFAIEEWHGGKVRHIVRDKVILLERGQVFEIEGKKFFTFGGAASHDIQGGVFNRNDADFKLKVKTAKERGLPYRIMRETWWPEELPAKEELFEGLKNLGKVDYKVDYIITHCCATSIQNIIDPGPGKIYEPDVLTDYLEQIEDRVQYKHWYFGHYHEDKRIDGEHTLLYKAMIPLDDVVVDLSKVPKLGHPVYRCGDRVSFKWNEEIKTGKVVIVDAYGTFEQNEEPSYDIKVEEENCLYKHIEESLVNGIESDFFRY